MTVPGRVEAAELLISLDPPAWFLRHARAVGEVAAWLAARVARADRRLVEAAAFLHDVDKLIPDRDPAGRLPHGAGSAAWLERQGFGELGAVVAGHPVTILAGPDGDRWLSEAGTEELILSYADKRAGQRLEPMTDRFESWARRYPGVWTPAETATARDRAARLESAVCELAGVGPADVRRLRWTGGALRRARSS
jgi:hypothetical protein